MTTAEIATPVVSGLTQYFLSKALGETDINDIPSLQQTNACMVQRIELMPQYLAWSLLTLTVMFDCYGLLFVQKRFRHQSFSQRERHISQWKNSPLGLCRDFIRFYEKMIIFVYYSLAESADVSGPDQGRLHAAKNSGM